MASVEHPMLKTIRRKITIVEDEEPAAELSQPAVEFDGGPSQSVDLTNLEDFGEKPEDTANTSPIDR